MERQASFLRCSKLNCYAEFNRMVQALSIHGKSDPHSNPLKPPAKGTGAEYNFYQTLSIMLQQVLSNPDSNAQRSELKMIYQWFTLNKPLVPQKVKPNAQRPKVSLSSKRTVLLPNRPQTAPAALYSRSTPVCPPSTPALTSFASSYMTRLIKTNENVIMPTTQCSRPATQPLPKRNNNHVKGGIAPTQDSVAIRPATTIPPTSKPNINNTSLLISGLTAGSVLDNATSVAAQMTLDRVMTKMEDSNAIFNGLNRGNNTRPGTTPPPQSAPSILKMPEDNRLVEMQDGRPAKTPPLQVERSRSLITLETITEVEYEEGNNHHSSSAHVRIADLEQSKQPSDDSAMDPLDRSTMDPLDSGTMDPLDSGTMDQEPPMDKDTADHQRLWDMDHQRPLDRSTMDQQRPFTEGVNDTGNQGFNDTLAGRKPEVDRNHVDYNNDTERTNSDTQIQVPKVTISNNKLNNGTSKTELYRSRSPASMPSAGAESNRKTICQVQVISLKLPNESLTSIDRNHQRQLHRKPRTPRKLVPIVAGFNQQHYRPRTVL